jgi:hypothetical protein
MPIQLRHDLSDLTAEQLFKIYLAIADADRRWRIRSSHGDQQPADRCCDWSPLRREQFLQRVEQSRLVAQGEQMLRQRLARQAATYRVDVESVLRRDEILGGSRAA